MLEPAIGWIRSLKDPFRNSNAAAQWIATLPTSDTMALQKEALDLVTSFPDGRRVIGPNQAEALLRIDARLEPVIGQLAHQYATNYQKSTDVETRLWHAVFDLVKAFAAAYAAVLRVGYPRAARLMEHLYEMGLVDDPQTGGKTRKSFVSEDDEDPIGDYLADS